VVLKIASPGVPDFYQGTELWELTLVDPDNRRPVDYDVRAGNLRALLELADREGPGAVCREVLDKLSDGRVKLWTMHRALALRREEHALFRRGEYLPLEVSGERREHVIAFFRRDQATGRSVVVVLPRFACTLMRGKVQLPLGEAWGKDQLLLPVTPGTRYRNVFTDEIVTVADDGLALSTVFATYPVGLFASEG
jgi:(1->4)-alpha-D-glucan 1-alpha-D-glucosylmutase